MKPTFPIIAVLILLALNASAQTVVFTVARAEMDCADAGNRSVRVLLDSSLKGYLDSLQFQDGQNCYTNPNHDSCKAYKAVKEMLETALRDDPSYPGRSEFFYLLEAGTGQRLYLEKSFDADDILYRDPLPEHRTARPARPADLSDSHLALDFIAPPVGPNEGALVLMANVKSITDGKSDTNPHIVKVKESANCGKVPAKLPTIASKEEVKDVRDHLVESSKAKDANVGASFALAGSRSNRVYSHDIAIQLGRVHRLGLGGAYDIIPFFFQHKFARDKKSPKDDLKFGAKVNHLLLFDPYSSRSGRPERDLFNSLTTTIAAQIETDFLFKEQVNFVGSWRTGLPINIFDERSSAARITPFIGYESGYRIKDVSPIGKSRLISRGLFGLDLFVAPWRKEKTNPFEIELNYIRRVLGREEPQYFVNADGKEVLGGFNSKPKDFVKARFTFNYNDRFAPFFQYTWGKEPGRYVLQNSVMEAGLKVYLKWEN